MVFHHRDTEDTEKKARRTRAGFLKTRFVVQALAWLRWGQTGTSPPRSAGSLVPVPGKACAYHSSDYAPQDWAISITELLRVIQFYNAGAYHRCDHGEDGFCPGVE